MKADTTVRRINVTLEFPEEALQDILITACEGGIGYWSQLESYDYRETSFVLREMNEDETDWTGPKHTLNHDVVALGLQRILSGTIEVSPSIRSSIMNELIEAVRGGGFAGDTTDCDCIVQAGLFNEIVYG